VTQTRFGQWAIFFLALVAIGWAVMFWLALGLGDTGSATVLGWFVAVLEMPAVFFGFCWLNLAATARRRHRVER
jgi:hypothetical protein